MKFFIILLLFILFSCQSVNYNLNDHYSYKESNGKIVLPNGRYASMVEYKSGKVAYTLGINDKSKILFISTKDANFAINNITLKSRLSELTNNVENIEHIPGWGYYIKCDSDWYAGFRHDSKPDKFSKIDWFFKFDFADASIYAPLKTN